MLEVYHKRTTDGSDLGVIDPNTSEVIAETRQVLRILLNDYLLRTCDLRINSDMIPTVSQMEMKRPLPHNFSWWICSQRDITGYTGILIIALLICPVIGID